MKTRSSRRSVARQVLWVVIAAALSMAARVAAGSEAAEESVEVSLEPLRYQTRGHGDVDAEVGRISVPENRGRTDSRVIEIAFVRLSGDSDRSGVPIVYLAGGPGGSGVEAGQGSRFRLFDALRASGDVVLLDQRGIGLSTQINPEECEEATIYPPIVL